MMKLKLGRWLAVGGATVLISACQSTSGGSNYTNLSAQGYQTSAMTTNQAGVRGWYVTGQGERYWCKANISTVYVGQDGMGIFLSSGRFISMDRAAYEEKAGAGDKGYPQLEDLEAGRPRAEDIHSCRKLDA